MTYTITYNLNGGKNSSSNPTTYNVDTSTITLANPTKTGYTFGGWYSDANFTTKVTQIAKGSTGNKTFYAKWTANKITVDYNEYGGAAIANGSCNYDGTLTLPTTSPVRDGFTFNGWLMADGTVQKTGSVACNKIGRHQWNSI